MKTVSIIQGIMAAALSIGAIAKGAETIDFQLQDSWGREVRSQDYRGRPIFLEFGACW